MAPGDNDPSFPLPYIPGALVRQEYRSLIDAGVWNGVFSPHHDLKFREGKIQPASFDTLTAPVVYAIPHGFKPEPGQSVTDTLRRANAKMHEIHSDGFVARQNKAWLIPLKGEYVIPDGYWLRSNPKSTQGRLGNKVRLIADGVPNYDTIYGPWKGGLYVLFEPKCWDNVIYEDLSLNQLRLFCGYVPPLSSAQLRERFAPNGLMRKLDGSVMEMPSPEFVHDGLLLTLDLVGRQYHGIVGFSAIESHEPLDQAKENEWARFFEVIEAPRTRRLQIDRRLKIFNSEFVYPTPPDLCGEMTAFMLETDNVRLHDAGFFDPGFSGTVTYEVENLGTHQAILDHGQRAGRIVYFQNRTIPDVLYGASETKSNYLNQCGPRIGKQFGGWDLDRFKTVSFKINKEKEPILAVSREDLGLEPGQPTYFQGFVSAGDRRLESIIDSNSLFLERGKAELMPKFKQPIAYVLLKDSSGRFFAYQRAEEPKDLTEKKLLGKWSIGVGGHVRGLDGPAGLDAVVASMDREIREEVVVGCPIEPRLVGFINDDRPESAEGVGIVHLAMVYVAHVGDMIVTPKSPEMREGKMYHPQEILGEVEKKNGSLEGWSEILIDLILNGKLMV